MRGRKPKPGAIARLQGNPGRRPIADVKTDAPSSASEAQASSDAPQTDRQAKPPAWLNTSMLVKTAAAKRLSKIAADVWNGLHDELVRLKLLKATDENAFARYCRYAAEWIEYTRALDREGAWYETSSSHIEGLIRPHPAFRFRKDVEHAMKELEDRIGLSPVARQRIFQQLMAAGRVPEQPSLPDAAPSKGGDKGRPTLDAGDAPFGFLTTEQLN